MTRTRVTQIVAALGLLTVLVLTIQSLAVGAGKSDEVVIGASIPISGQLASFGSFEQWGYQHAVAQVNAQGGVTVNGKRRRSS
jgi:branched-chain amino acid transport system substrate-binding protein